MWNGHCSRIASKTGSSHASPIRAVHPITCDCVTSSAALLHLPVLAEPPHQPVHRRTTQTRHLDQVPQQQPAHGFRLFLVLLRPQGPFYPAVNLFPVQRLETHLLAGRQKPLDLLDCERFGSLHCHLHRPAVSPLAPTPPLSGLQHHLALETPALLSIILYWKRLRGHRSSCPDLQSC